MTKQQKLILNIINSSKSHPSAEDVYLKAKKIMPSIAIGTVYRNLGMMSEKGIIRKITMVNSPDRFDKSLIPHEHLICNKCGELTDIKIPDIKKYLIKATDVDVLGYELCLYHVCNKCKKKEDENEKI